MNLLKLLEAAEGAKKYTDKDGKVVHRLPKKEKPQPPKEEPKPNHDDWAPEPKAKPKFKPANKFKVGQRVEYTGAGKVSRAEGMEGKKCTGVITRVDDDRDMVSVMPDHRTKPDAQFYDMGTVIPMSDVQLLRDGSPFDRPTDDELFGHCGYDKRIRRRKKGEKMDPNFIGSVLRFAHEKNGKLYYMGPDGKRDPNPMATVEVVGYTYVQHPMHETWHETQTLELRFENGSIVPATRRGPGYMISQDYDFKAYMPSGAAKFWSIIRDHNNR